MEWLSLIQLASLMYKYKTLQTSQVRLSFLQNLPSFVTTKYLKQEVNDDISICMDEHSPCDLSITGDIRFINVTSSKFNDVTKPNGEVPYGLLSGSCFYSPNLITVTPLWRWWSHYELMTNGITDYELMTSLLTEYRIEPFKWGLPAA